ncbi:MAG: Uma2 family endonuclease [Thermomicrobiales bacterium]
MAIKQLMTNQLMSAEQFAEIPDTPGKQFELVNGEVIEVPLASHMHARIVMALVRLLDPYVRTHDLGEIYADGLGYVITRMPDSVRGPDVSFLMKEHVPDEDFSVFVPFAPDLAIEIVSPNDRADEVHDKVYQYLAAGTRLVWVLWPKTCSISIFGKGGTNGEFGMEDELDGGDVLPGFRVRVAELFDVRAKR